MRILFNELKAAQVAYRLLELGGGRTLYIRLIKLLYLLDRAALLKWGRPITTDHYASMEHGPVVKDIYTLITESPITPGQRSNPSAETLWNRYILRPSQYMVRTSEQNPGVSKLSKSEEEMILAVHKNFGGKDRQQLIDYCHKHLPEWKNPGKGRSLEIQISDILNGGNKTPTEIEEIESELESFAVLQRMRSHE